MGYTHYIYHKRALTDSEWTALCAATRSILDEAAKDGIQLAWADGQGEPEIDGAPLPDDGDVGRVISFNGAAPNDHEPLLLTQKPNPKQREFEPGEGKFSFCKTARKPYDRVVVDVLRAAKRIAPDAYTLNSDGDREGCHIFPV